MKDHFIRLFEYDAYANKLMTALILQTGENDLATKVMAHVLAAQLVWYVRCKNQLTDNYTLWPTWQADILSDTITAAHKNWIIYLNGLQPGDLEKNISYQNTKGYLFNNTLANILTHVINHGTHHRAQAGQYLKESGVALPPTDYIFYLRELNAAT